MKKADFLGLIEYIQEQAYDERDKPLLLKIIGSLLGVRIGDALGMPVETWSDKQIREYTQGRGVSDYLDPKATGQKWFQELKAGDYTDDWQLTRALLRSLISRKQVDHKSIAMEHIAEFNLKKSGWGGTTIKAIEEIKDYFDSSTAGGRSPLVFAAEPAQGKGCGNGVAMKIAPLALYYQSRFRFMVKEPLLEDTVEIGMMTHGDVRASIAAYLVALIIANNIYHPQKQSMDYAARKSFLKRLISEVQIAEFKYQMWGDRDDRISERLALIHDQNLILDLKKLKKIVGTGCYALESVPFCIALFLRNPGNFKRGVLEAVNAGGDTDSNAAIVGSMVGANVGLNRIPPEFFLERTDFMEAVELGVELYKMTAEIYHGSLLKK